MINGEALIILIPGLAAVSIIPSYHPAFGSPITAMPAITCDHGDVPLRGTRSSPENKDLAHVIPGDIPAAIRRVSPSCSLVSPALSSCLDVTVNRCNKTTYITPRLGESQAKTTLSDLRSRSYEKSSILGKSAP